MFQTQSDMFQTQPKYSKHNHNVPHALPSDPLPSPQKVSSNAGEAVYVAHVRITLPTLHPSQHVCQHPSSPHYTHHCTGPTPQSRPSFGAVLLWGSPRPSYSRYCSTRDSRVRPSLRSSTASCQLRAPLQPTHGPPPPQNPHYPCTYVKDRAPFIVVCSCTNVVVNK